MGELVFQFPDIFLGILQFFQSAFFFHDFTDLLIQNGSVHIDPGLNPDVDNTIFHPYSGNTDDLGQDYTGGQRRHFV